MRINLPNPENFAKIFEQTLGFQLETGVIGIATDSREVQPGDLYIAIEGERVDGHAFIQNAFENGAKCALVKKIDSKNDSPQIVINDPLKAIGDISKMWRKQFEIPVIGITGSNGKTSTKELLKHILSDRFIVHATEGNFNTSIGLPLTILQLTKKHSASILEMGANQPEDIKVLCKIALPNYGIITNIAPAHLEGFGTIESVAETKGALFQSLKNGISFVNAADKHIVELEIPGKFVSFGLTPSCTYPADIYHEEDGTITLTIDAEEIPTNSANLSFAKNVIACTAIARTLDLEWKDIKNKITTFQPPEGRCDVKNNGKITIIDDTYNANLESTVAAIDYLKALSGDGNRIFVFGDMFELGASSAEQHRYVGEKCDEAELAIVYTLGSETIATDLAMNTTRIHEHFNNKNDLLDSLKAIVSDGDKILVKGSRGMEMEIIVEAMLQT